MLNECRESDSPDIMGAPPAPAPHRARGCRVEGAEAKILSALACAVLSPDRAEGERQLRELIEDGIDRTRLIDEWVPAVARHFGEAWMQSGHSFAEVSIATARLQGWLRELEPARQETPFRLDAPEVLMVVADGAHHTLGAMVAMSRFRRLGALVRLSLGQDARTIGQQVGKQHIDMVALSAAGNEDLDFLSTVINSIRSGIGPVPQIVLGGEILNQIPDAPALIGADHSTSDPEEALRLCGLTISASAERLRTVPSFARGQPERVPTRA